MAQLNVEVTSVQTPDKSLAARFCRRKSSLVGSSDAQSVVKFTALVSISAWKGQASAIDRVGRSNDSLSCNALFSGVSYTPAIEPSLLARSTLEPIACRRRTIGILAVDNSQAEAEAEERPSARDAAWESSRASRHNIPITV